MTHDAQQPVTPPGIILVAHEVLTSISQEHMLGALPAQWRALPRELVRIRSLRLEPAGLDTVDWTAARRQQRAEVELLKHTIDTNPGWRIAYFGAAPIPLAIDLGYQLGTWQSIQVYQQHHDSKNWGWPAAAGSAQARFRKLELPSGRITAEGDVVLRLSLSHQVDPAVTAAVVGHNLGEIDIALEAPTPDAFQSPDDLDELRRLICRVLDWVTRDRPNAELHVFGAMPVGASVCFGASINPTLHPVVHTYQYSQRTTPAHTRALTLQRDEQRDTALTDDQITAAADLRRDLAEELRTIAAFSSAQAHQRTDSGASWLDGLVPGSAAQLFCGAVRELASIDQTPLAESAVDLVTREVSDGFCFDTAGLLWRLGDRLLVAFVNQFPDLGQRRQAGRLLLLHEGIHLKSHGLTGATAPQVRRFPKIVEEMDYQADVWAFMHDFAIQANGSNVNDRQARAFFLDVVGVALKTFWAFDSRASRERIEIRRLNRYLIWYWQLLRLERQSDLEGVLKVLAHRPLLEVAGPKIESHDERVYYSLVPDKIQQPEISILLGHRFTRYGDGPGTPVGKIFEGFREADGEKVRSALQAFSDQAGD